MQWNTLMGVDLAPAGALRAGHERHGHGADGGAAHVREGRGRREGGGGAPFSEGWRFALEDSYLRGLSDFDVAIRQGRGLQHLGRRRRTP